MRRKPLEVPTISEDHTEEQRVKAQPVSDLNAPELVLRAFALGGEDSSLAGMTAAGKLADQALRLEPIWCPR